MKISRDKGGIVWTYSKHDVFKRQFILMSSKLIDESVNNWFRSYLMRYYKDVDISTKGIKDKETEKKFTQIKEKSTKVLMDKYGFTDKDFNIALMEFRGVEVSPDKSKTSYTLNNEKLGITLKFDYFNGYWYESADHPEYAFFDYGDFYCMGDVLPLATFYVILTNQWRRTHG